VVIDVHAEPSAQAFDGLLEVGVIERGQRTADLTDHVMVMVATGVRRLVTGFGATHLEPLDEPVLHEDLKRPVDACAADGSALRAQCDLDVVGAQCARLGRQQVDDLGARATTPVAGLLEDRAGVGAPVSVVN
jgi:hypothetical protein